MSSLAVLVVDDDERLAALVERLLTKAGIPSQICSTGTEAVERVVENPDLVMLLDYQLRDLRGREVIDTLIERGIAPNFLMMTGQGDEQLAVDCMKLGALDYLVKDTGFLDLVIPAVERAIDILDTRRRLREAEASLTRQLEEKEILLREVHHRVRNNLAIISSLVSLQTDSIATPEQALRAFDKTRDRIVTLSLVHQQLYESQDYSSIDFHDYLQHVVAHLVEQYGRADGPISVVLRCDGVSVNADDAIPVGLIVSELVSNSLLYAFPEGTPGTITVALSEDAGLYRLTVQDDGIGLPPGCTDQGSLGLTLVFSLISQIKGTGTTEGADGACFAFEWPRRRMSHRDSKSGSSPIGTTWTAPVGLPPERL